MLSPVFLSAADASLQEDKQLKVIYGVRNNNGNLAVIIT